MKNVSLNRNYTIDLLKLIAAYFIVFIHVPFYGDFGVIITNIARFAVPVFFITSGFFCYNNNVDKIRNKQRHIIRIFVFAALVYNVCNLIMCILNGGEQAVITYFSQFVDVANLVDFFVFNDTISATRLWFLPALIYTYAIQKIIVKKDINKKRILVVSIFLLIINLFCVEVLPVIGMEIPVHYTRNFLFTGYPFFGIGLCLKWHNDKIKNVRIKYFVILLCVGLVYAIISAHFIKPAELNIGVTVVAISAFIIAMKLSEVSYSASLIKLFQCSLGIYILHRPITTVLNMLGSACEIGNEIIFYGFFLPILVCITTTICVMILNMVLNRKTR